MAKRYEAVRSPRARNVGTFFRSNPLRKCSKPLHHLHWRLYIRHSPWVAPKYTRVTPPAQRTLVRQKHCGRVSAVGAAPASTTELPVSDDALPPPPPANEYAATDV
jgi:hypothetical protein